MTNRYGFYFGNSKMASRSSRFHPSKRIKAQTAKQFRLRQQSLNVPPPLPRGALDRLVTSGASNDDASRSRANKDGANNRNVGTAGKPTGASMGGDSIRNNGKDDSIRNGDTGGNTRSNGGASTDGTGNRSANTPWRCWRIAYQ